LGFCSLYFTNFARTMAGHESLDKETEGKQKVKLTESPYTNFTYTKIKQFRLRLIT